MAHFDWEKFRENRKEIRERCGRCEGFIDGGFSAHSLKSILSTRRLPIYDNSKLAPRGGLVFDGADGLNKQAASGGAIVRTEDGVTMYYTEPLRSTAMSYLDRMTKKASRNVDVSKLLDYRSLDMNLPNKHVGTDVYDDAAFARADGPTRSRIEQLRQHKATEAEKVLSEALEKSGALGVSLQSNALRVRNPDGTWTPWVEDSQNWHYTRIEGKPVEIDGKRYFRIEDSNPSPTEVSKSPDSGSGFRRHSDIYLPVDQLFRVRSVDAVFKKGGPSPLPENYRMSEPPAAQAEEATGPFSGPLQVRANRFGCTPVAASEPPQSGRAETRHAGPHL